MIILDNTPLLTPDVPRLLSLRLVHGIETRLETKHVKS